MAFLTENRSARLEFRTRETPFVSYFSDQRENLGRDIRGICIESHRIALSHTINRKFTRKWGKKFDYTYPTISRKVKSTILILISIFINL